MNPLSTPEVARRVGVHWITLERWLTAGKIPRPKQFEVGGRVVRLWTARDLKRVERYKADFYRKGRGRKKTPKS